jgi:hypothetical protein
MIVPYAENDAISGCEALYSQPRDGEELIGLGNSKVSNDTQSETYQSIPEAAIRYVITYVSFVSDNLLISRGADLHP